MLDYFTLNQHLYNYCLAIAILSIMWRLTIEFVTNLPSFFRSNKRGSVEIKGNRNIISYKYIGDNYKVVIYKPSNMRIINQLEIKKVETIKNNKNCTEKFKKFMGPNKDFHGSYISTADLLRSSKIKIYLNYKRSSYELTFKPGDHISIKSILKEINLKNF